MKEFPPLSNKESEYSEQIYWLFVLIRFLKDQKFPNKNVREINSFLWKAIKSRVIPLMIHEGAPFLGFATMSGEKEFLLNKGFPPNSILTFGKSFGVGALSIPRDLPSLVEENPSRQLGFLVFNASIARDFITGRLVRELRNPFSQNFWEERARAFEAELVKTFKTQYGFILDPYQESVLKKFPHGLDSLKPELRYLTPNFFDLFPNLYPSHLN